MLERIKGFLSEILEVANTGRPDLKSKARRLEITEYGYLTKYGYSDNFIYVRIKNTEEGTFHTVFLDLLNLAFYCSPTMLPKEIKEKFKQKEDYCYAQHSIVRKPTDKFCHHIYAMAKYLSDERMDLIQERLEKLGLTSTTSKPFDLIEFVVDNSERLLIYGDTGAGKTYSVLKAVKEKNLPLFQINCSGGIEDVDVLMRVIPEEGKWKTVDGVLTQAFKSALKQKTVLLIEELTRASRSLRNLLIKSLDEKDNCYELHNLLSNDIIRVPKENLVVFATANIGYADTEELDMALMRRFSFILEKGYDKEVEMRFLEDAFGDKSKQIYSSFIEPVRKLYREGHISIPLDTGTIETLCKYSGIMGFSNALKFTVLYRYPSEERDLITELVKSLNL